MTVSEKISKYLSDNGISQTYVSQKANISLPKLNLALNGKRKFTFPEYEAICFALGLPVTKFLRPKPLTDEKTA